MLFTRTPPRSRIPGRFPGPQRARGYQGSVDAAAAENNGRAPTN
jgi:hypothetical protein